MDDAVDVPESSRAEDHNAVVCYYRTQNMVEIQNALDHGTCVSMSMEFAGHRFMTQSLYRVGEGFNEDNFGKSLVQIN
jgi:hypothetical protein